MTIYLIVYFGAVLAAILMVPIVSRSAKRWNLLDAPSARKVHKIPLPRVGGIAIVAATLALVLPVFFFSNTVGESFRQSRSQFIALLSGAFCIFVVGLIDDLHPLAGGIKLLSLVVAALIVCASGATISSFSLASLFSVRTGLAAWPITVCWIVGIAVCVSAIDGLDGLAAGIAAIVCGILVILALWSGQEAMAVLMMALLGGITGFLFFNFYPAKIFMGDCGSLFLGFMIGAGSVVCQMKTSTIVGLAIPFLVLGVPILDTGLVVAFRAVIQRRSMFAPDRNHLHHRLLRLGLHHRTAVIVIYAMTAICASLGIFMLRAKGNWSVTLLVGGIALMFSMFVCLQRGRYRRLLNGLKRNLAVAHQARIQNRRFEDTQVRMRESVSFSAWWQTLCSMAAEMGFRSLGLWERENGAFVNTCVWSAQKQDSSVGRILQLSLPVQVKEGLDRELRACIVAQNYLELGGRQAMLLTRLMDEFPMPERRQDRKAGDKTADTTQSFRTDAGTLDCRKTNRRDFGDDN